MCSDLSFLTVFRPVTRLCSDISDCVQIPVCSDLSSDCVQTCHFCLCSDLSCGCVQITWLCQTSVPEPWRTGAWSSTARRRCSSTPSCPPAPTSTWSRSSWPTRSPTRSVTSRHVTSHHDTSRRAGLGCSVACLLAACLVGGLVRWMGG